MRLLFVEDEPWVRTGVTKLLEAASLDLTVCPDIRSAVSALSTPFDAALIDLGLPDGSGVDLIVALRDRQPSCVAVAFTKFDDAPTILSALRAGARGYLLKSTPSDRIVPALHDALAGGLPLSAAVAQLVVDTALGAAAPDTHRLTQRETELLRLLARGRTYAECATELGIGLGTVQTYVKAIYAKLDVSSKAEAALAAVRLGLVR
jgi:DNA-binding NarL/FixJ family response regulator